MFKISKGSSVWFVWFYLLGVQEKEYEHKHTGTSNHSQILTRLFVPFYLLFVQKKGYNHSQTKWPEHTGIQATGRLKPSGLSSALRAKKRLQPKSAEMARTYWHIKPQVDLNCKACLLLSVQKKGFKHRVYQTYWQIKPQVDLKLNTVRFSYKNAAQVKMGM